MKKAIVLGALFLFGQIGFAQEVKSEIEIVNEIKTVFFTINADRFSDLKDFDWQGNLTEVFKDIPDEAKIGIKVNIEAKQLTNDIATLPNKMSLMEVGIAKNKEHILKRIVKTVKLFIEDEQQGYNIEN